MILLDWNPATDSLAHGDIDSILVRGERIHGRIVANDWTGAFYEKYFQADDGRLFKNNRRVWLEHCHETGRAWERIGSMS